MAKAAEDLSSPIRLRGLRRLLGRPARAWNCRRRRRESAAHSASTATETMIDVPTWPLTGFTGSPQFGRVPWLEPADCHLMRALSARLEALTEGLATLLQCAADSNSDGARGFPQKYSPTPAEGQIQSGTLRQAQDLVATGGKQWGSWWDGRALLKVKIYDFALYANPSHLSRALPVLTATPDPDAHVSRPSRLRRRRHCSSTRQQTISDETLASRIVSDNRVDLTLCVRPARDLPLGMMRSEYHRILQKRICGVGGSVADPSLAELMRYFDEQLLPSGSTCRGCVRKGTVLHFSRSRNGNLTAVANGVRLTTVNSAKLCEAVFDLYLGQQPVSKQARSDASETFREKASERLLLTV